jgi:hypothetical protein
LSKDEPNRMANFVEQIRRPMLRRLYAYWDIRRGDREFPGRPDLDPLDMGFALGNVSLIDVLHEPLRFRYRLHGSIIAERIGIDMTGRFVDEIAEPDRRGFVEENFRTVVATRQPLARSGQRTLDQRLWNFDSIILPLGPADGAIDMLLLGVEYHNG